MIEILKAKGFLIWITNWIENNLSDRTAYLFFDSEESTSFQVQAGVPQGSPLSPILFILYISTLYTELEKKIPGVLVVGFADDTNLLSIDLDIEMNCRRLEEA